MSNLRFRRARPGRSAQVVGGRFVAATMYPPLGNAGSIFAKGDWRSKSVEQLSQLFTARHASGLERKHLGQMFYNKYFTALPVRDKPDGRVLQSKLGIYRTLS